MKLLIMYFKNFKLHILLALLFKVIATSLSLFLPWAFAHIVNVVVPQKSIEMLMVWAVLMIVSAFLTAFLSVVAAHLSVKFGIEISKKIRQDIFKKTCNMDCEKIENFGISSITSRATTDISSIQVFISKMMTKGVTTILTFIGSLFSVTMLDFKLALVMFCVVPLISITIYLATKIGYNYFKDTKKANDSLVKVIRENILGIRVIRALSTFDRENDNFNNINEELYRKNIKASSVGAISTPIMRFIVNIGMVATLLMGAYLIKLNQSNIASLIAFMSYFTMLLTSLIGIGQIFTMYSKCAAAASRISEILETENKSFVANEFDASNSFIEFRNVSFAYNENFKVLKNISFTIEKNESLGIIGSVGSGKSTIIHLLLRLYQPSSGTIYIDNKPINSYSTKELYEKFGVCFQSDIIFSDDVYENVSFGRKVDEINIENACKSAQALKYIQKLKDGFNTIINIRGQNMSGGEKQRVLIARALAQNPKILVLDDTTSALDYKTDADLRLDLINNYRDTTKIFVSQRISTIINSNKIIVLDNGEIIAEGNHENLLKTCEIYQKISYSQLGDSTLYT